MSKARTGPRNLITDVAGIAVGNAEDAGVRSGVTVVLPETPAVCAADARGGGTGTRELALLEPEQTVRGVHAVVLSGGSAYGLDAAGGVMRWLAARGRGFHLHGALVPIIPAAILFDLANGGDKPFMRGDCDPPYHRLALQAAEAAGETFALGNAGAGLGATVGALLSSATGMPLQGGLGSASLVLGDGVTVGALAAVNAFGSPLMADGDTFWAWPFERDGEFGGGGPPRITPPAPALTFTPPGAGARQAGMPTQTTLGVVATDATLDKVAAKRLAIMAQDGLARALRPVHTPYDGDVVFALATGRRPLADPIADLARLGAAAADCLARAIARGVYEAASLANAPCYRDRRQPGGARA